MSGPVTTEDVPATPGDGAASDGPVVEIEPGRVTQVGSLPVRRVLPHRPRKTVGAWCFADHMGPIAAEAPGSFGIGPHPHMGLQTVTWLLAGQMLHLDSLGSEQLIRPGQLNLMTAGFGVAHAEEDPGRSRTLHGIQLWVAQPEATRNGAAAFEHHDDLPKFDIGDGEGTILVGDYNGLESPARRDTEHVGVELLLRRGVLLPLRTDYEHALIVLEGRVRLGDQVVAPGVLAYLGEGREDCPVDLLEPARVLLLGGVPFPEQLLMWWNFVARTTDEASEARRQWTEADARFGVVRSRLERIDVGRPPWD